MPKYTIVTRADGARKILKDGQFYFIMAVYNNTLDFKVQEIAQQVVDALNKADQST